MEPSGWMIIPADDTFEPIFAFGNDPMTREAYEQSPLFCSVVVVYGNLTVRVQEGADVS